MNRRGFLQVAGGLALAQFLPASADEPVVKSGGFRVFDLHARLQTQFRGVTSSQAYRVSRDGMVALRAHIGGHIKWFWAYLDAETYPFEAPDPESSDYLTVSPDSSHVAWRVSGGPGKSNVFRVYQPKLDKQRLINFGAGDFAVGGVTADGTLVIKLGKKTAIARLDSRDTYRVDDKSYANCRIYDLSPSGTLCGRRGREPIVGSLNDTDPTVLPQAYRRGTSYALGVSPNGEFIVGGWLKPGAKETLPLAWRRFNSKWRSIPISASTVPFGFLNSVDDRGQAVGAGFKKGVPGVSIYARGVVDTSGNDINPRLATKADLSEKDPIFRSLLKETTGFRYPWRCAVDSYHTYDSGNAMNGVGYVCGWAANDGPIGTTFPRAVAFKRLSI